MRNKNKCRITGKTIARG